MVVGPEWSSLKGANGPPRLADPFDFGRIEVEEGLKREHVRGGIPVLVENSVMPGEQEMPASLKALRFRQAAVVRNDPDFNRDIEGLIAILTDQKPVALAPDGETAFGLWETSCIVVWKLSTGEAESCWTHSAFIFLQLLKKVGHISRGNSLLLHTDEPV